VRVSMKIVAWNCRVLRNRPTVRGLLGFQKSEGVDILFLLETKLDKLMMVRFQWMLGLPNTLVQKGDGKGGDCCVLAERNRCIIAWHVTILY
jgi:exonuclease III